MYNHRSGLQADLSSGLGGPYVPILPTLWLHCTLPLGQRSPGLLQLLQVLPVALSAGRRTAVRFGVAARFSGSRSAECFVEKTSLSCVGLPVLRAGRVGVCRFGRRIGVSGLLKPRCLLPEQLCCGKP